MGSLNQFGFSVPQKETSAIKTLSKKQPQKIPKLGANNTLNREPPTSN